MANYYLGTWNMQGANKWSDIVTVVNNLRADRGEMLAFCVQECGDIPIGGTYKIVLDEERKSFAEKPLSEECGLYSAQFGASKYYVMTKRFHDGPQGVLGIIFPSTVKINECGYLSPLDSSFDTERLVGIAITQDPDYLPAAGRAAGSTETMLGKRSRSTSAILNEDKPGTPHKGIHCERGIVYVDMTVNEKSVVIMSLHAPSLGDQGRRPIKTGAWCLDNILSAVKYFGARKDWVCLGDFNCNPEYVDLTLASAGSFDKDKEYKKLMVCAVSTKFGTQQSLNTLDYLVTSISFSKKISLATVGSGLSDHISQAFMLID